MTDKYAVSGSNITQVAAVVSVTGGSGAPGDGTAIQSPVNVLGRNNETGKGLWLRNFWYANASAPFVANLLDASEGHVTDATGFRQWQKAAIPVASGTATNMSVLTMVEFSAPGLRFATGCVISKDANNQATTLGAPGTCGGSGYYA